MFHNKAEKPTIKDRIVDASKKYFKSHLEALGERLKGYDVKGIIEKFGYVVKQIQKLSKDMDYHKYLQSRKIKSKDLPKKHFEAYKVFFKSPQQPSVDQSSSCSLCNMMAKQIIMYLNTPDSRDRILEYAAIL